MRPRFRADENFNAKIRVGLLRREPSADFLTASSAGILGIGDPDVLAIAAHTGRTLISHDRETMPAHISRFISRLHESGFIDRGSALGFEHHVPTTG
jgi:hypothetical protein